jgi:hypothetical protein
MLLSALKHGQGGSKLLKHGHDTRLQEALELPSGEDVIVSDLTEGVRVRCRLSRILPLWCLLASKLALAALKFRDLRLELLPFSTLFL